VRLIGFCWTPKQQALPLRYSSSNWARNGCAAGNRRGEPFRKLLNQNAEIPAEASRVCGYASEILERDGEPPVQVYRAFAEYAGSLPLVSYNLEYDLDEVLMPEWKRLRIASIGSPGLCALRLAQRLLDPVPAGNCKLQTLRQYYGLPERGAHTALGDVQTVADLFANVLRPIAGHRGLDTWEKLAAFAAEEWYPSRIAFGKHKGRLIQEARTDAALRGWLDWLAGSSNARNARMGRWYLRQLEVKAESAADGTVFATPEAGDKGGRGGKPGAVGLAALVIYVNPELEQLRQLMAAANR
jgi:DNA polymerase III epsilon subunit-like protein